MYDKPRQRYENLSACAIGYSFPSSSLGMHTYNFTNTHSQAATWEREDNDQFTGTKKGATSAPFFPKLWSSD